jgi:hypothetical protein
MRRLLLLAGLIVVCWSVPAAALEIGGVQLPDTAGIGGRTLVLNGAGLRTKLFFKIYAGGLYLEQATHDAETVINADAPMLVRMQFIYDGVSAEKMQDGWKEGFAVTAPDPSDNLEVAIEAFVDFFTEEVREGDVYEIAWIPDKGVQVAFNGTILGVVTGLDFKKALFAVWFGPHPVDDDLKEGMLGR